MKCYFDVSEDAQGFCKSCGRFVCRRHSQMKEGQLVCLECAAGGSESLYEHLADVLRQGKQSSCPVCDRTLYELYEWEKLAYGLHKAEYDSLSDELQDRLREEFPYECPEHIIECERAREERRKEEIEDIERQISEIRVPKPPPH